MIAPKSFIPDRKRLEEKAEQIFKFEKEKGIWPFNVQECYWKFRLNQDKILTIDNLKDYFDGMTDEQAKKVMDHKVEKDRFLDGLADIP